MTTVRAPWRRLAASVLCLSLAALAACGEGAGESIPGSAAQDTTAGISVRRPAAAGDAPRIVDGPLDLGTPTDADSRVSAISDRGQAVGLIDSRTPFIWDQTAGVRAIDGLPDCGGETPSVEVGDVNSRGQVVGTVRCMRIRGSDDISVVSIRAFVWSFAQGARVLPEPAGLPFTQAAAINESGAVAGRAAADALAAPQAVMWLPDGTVRYLGAPTALGSAAADINDAGQVVGTRGNHAFLWNEGDGLRDLGTLGGPSSSAARINNRGQVVGSSTTGSTPVVVAGFLWTPERGMESLGTLGGGASFANALSDDGLIVGASMDASGRNRPVLWSASGLIQDIGSDGTSGSATGIDAAGRIVGNLYVGPATRLRASSWTVRAAASRAYTLWPDTVRPALEVDPDTSAVELGVRFRATTDGYVPGLRFYKAVGDVGPYVVNLWTGEGERLGSAVVGTSGTGWIRVDFPRPLALRANQVYVASYFAPRGGYPADVGYFARAGVRSGPLEAFADDATGHNGVYRYGDAGGFPDQSYESSNYWVDVVFVPGDLPPVSFWNDTSLPRTAVTEDANAVEVGMRWHSSQAGLVSAIRFYRGVAGTQPHTVNLWTADGTRLYSAEVATGTGWITARLPRPVAVEAHRDYVVSYFAPEGLYASDNDFFTPAPALAWMLEAPADTPQAGNGLYAYGPRSSFPTQSYRATNYWVDVVFEPR